MWNRYKRLFKDINVNSIICIAHKSHYEALKIPKTATHKEIKDAYYRLSMIYHPDKNKGSDEAAKIFRDITTAYEVLGNVRQKKLYDSGLDPNQKTSQYNSKQPFETMNVKSKVRIKDQNFDDWSKSQYTNILRQHHSNKEMNMRKKIIEQHTERQNTYSIVTIIIGIGIILITMTYEQITIFLNEHNIVNNVEKSVKND